MAVKVTNGSTVLTYTVIVTRVSAKLSALSIGSLTLTPSFDSGVLEYTTETTNATNTITATAEDTEATILIKVGETVVENGSAATWETGVNTVTVDVTSGTATLKYTVTVTKGE